MGESAARPRSAKILPRGDLSGSPPPTAERRGPQNRKREVTDVNPRCSLCGTRRSAAEASAATDHRAVPPLLHRAVHHHHHAPVHPGPDLEDRTTWGWEGRATDKVRSTRVHRHDATIATERHGPVASGQDCIRRECCGARSARSSVSCGGLPRTGKPSADRSVRGVVAVKSVPADFAGTLGGRASDGDSERTVLVKLEVELKLKGQCPPGPDGSTRCSRRRKWRTPGERGPSASSHCASLLPSLTSAALGPTGQTKCAPIRRNPHARAASHFSATLPMGVGAFDSGPGSRV